MTGDEGPFLDQTRLTNGPRRVPPLDAAIIDQARRAIMARGGIKVPDAEVPAMTIRPEPLPTGTRPLEISTLMVSLEPDTPPVRARLTSALRRTTGMPIVRPVKDGAKHWRYEMFVRSTIDFAVVAAIWRAMAQHDGVAYARLDGIEERGIWVLDNPEGGADPIFTLSGIANPQ